MGQVLTGTALGMPCPSLPPVSLFLILALPLTILIGLWVRRRMRTEVRASIRWLTAGAICIVFFLLLALHFHYFPEGVDDSFISYRYAENLAHGQGLVFNAGDRVEGFSNPLWVAILAVLSSVGVGIQASDYALPLAAKLLSITCHIATFVLLLWWATRRASNPITWVAALAGALWMLAAGANTVWAVTGMETSLHGLLLLIAAVAWSDVEGENLPVRPRLLTAILLLLVLSRPEGAFLSAVLLTVWGGSDWARLGKFSRAWTRAALLFGGFVIAITIFRIAYFGNVLPNTFWAKATGDPVFQIRHGLQYLAGALLVTGGWLWLPVLLWKKGTGGFGGVMPVTLIAAQAIFVLLTGGDWMFAYRFWAPMIPLGAMGLIGFLNRHTETFERWLRPRISLRRLAAAMMVMIAAGSVQALAFERVLFFQNDYRTSGFIRLDLYPHASYYGAALAMRRIVPAGTEVALGEMGLIPYVSGVKTLDCHGLVSREIARLPGLMHQKTGATDILRYHPDYVLLGTSQPSLEMAILSGLSRFETELLASGEFHQLYRPVWNNDRYTLYERVELGHDFQP